MHALSDSHCYITCSAQNRQHRSYRVYFICLMRFEPVTICGYILLILHNQLNKCIGSAQNLRTVRKHETHIFVCLSFCFTKTDVIVKTFSYLFVRTVAFRNFSAKITIQTKNWSYLRFYISRLMFFFKIRKYESCICGDKFGTHCRTLYLQKIIFIETEIVIFQDKLNSI